MVNIGTLGRFLLNSLRFDLGGGAVVTGIITFVVGAGTIELFAAVAIQIVNDFFLGPARCPILTDDIRLGDIFNIFNKSGCRSVGRGLRSVGIGV